MKELLREIDWKYRPIPDVPSVAGWKEKPIKECGEPLVPLGIFGEYSDIATVGMYAAEANISPYVGEPIKGSLLTMFVRDGVAKRLRTGEKKLPYGMHLVVQDPYRTI